MLTSLYFLFCSFSHRLLRRNEAEEADDSSATSVLIPVIEDSIARASMKERANSSNLLARQKKIEVARRALGG